MRQIDRGGTCSGGTVQGGAGLHVVRHIGDGHPQRALPVLVHEAHGIVEVLGVGWVDGHQRKMSQIGASRSHLVVARDLAQGVGVVDERCVVSAREGVAVLVASTLQASVEEFSGRPPACLHQQEGHRRFVVSETEAGTDGGALACFPDEVEALHRGATLVVKCVGTGQRLAQKHGFPDVLEEVVHRHVGLAGVLCGQRRSSVQGCLSLTGVAAEEILPPVHGCLKGVEGGFGAEANGLVLVGQDVRGFFSAVSEGFVDLAQQGAFSLGVGLELT